MGGGRGRGGGLELPLVPHFSGSALDHNMHDRRYKIGCRLFCMGGSNILGYFAKGYTIY